MKKIILKAVFLWLTFLIGMATVLMMSSLSLVLLLLAIIMGIIIKNNYTLKELYTLSGSKYFDSIIEKSED